MSKRFGVHSGEAKIGSLVALGRQKVHHVSVSSDYSVKGDDFIVGVDTSGAAVTVTIPSSIVEEGRLVIINDEGGNAGVNNITIATEGSETIDGAASALISSNNGSLGLYSDGSNWFSY